MASLMFLCPSMSYVFLIHRPVSMRLACHQLLAWQSFLCKKIPRDVNPRLSSHHVQLRPPFDHQDSWETSGFAPGLPPSHRLERKATKRAVNTFQSRCQPPPKTKWYYCTIPSIDQYIKSSYNYNKNNKMTQWISQAPYCSQHKSHPIRPEALTTR